MKKALSVIMALVLVLSMMPVITAKASAEPVILTIGTDVAASAAAPVTYTWTAEADGTLTVTMGACTPGWRYTISDANGNTVGLPKTGKTEKSADFELTGGSTYTFTATGYNTSTWDVATANITYTLSFLADEGEADVEVAEYEVSSATLALGDNTLSLLETAVTTIYVFKPAESGYYTFTAPEGAILGYWGAGSWFLSNPGSTTNTYEWLCTSAGQSAYIGVSNVSGSYNLNVTKTGDYTYVETPIVAYENKATLAPFSIPEGSTMGGYIDVNAEEKHTVILGDDGYYHLNSIDGPVILVDMDYQDIVLSAALQSDRPVMYAYTTDEEGNAIKYDIGNAILAYEEVMDANGYYPLTEDLILFYDTYAVGAGVYTFYVKGNYNEDNIWLYCMRTVTFPEETEPSEPEITEPEITEPEVTEPEVTEPDVTEPEVTEPEVTEPEVTQPANGVVVFDDIVSGSSSTKYVYSYTPEKDGILSITVGDGTASWNSDVIYFVGISMTTVGTASGLNAGTYEVNVTAGTAYRIRVWTSSAAATPLTIVFKTDDEPTEPEVTEPEVTEPEVTEPKEYEVSDTELSVGNNTVTMLSTAITTVFKFKPTATGTYTFTVPAGAVVGNWGSNAYYLFNPNSTENTCQWTCSGLGQSVFIGVSGVDGSIVLNVALDEPEEPEVTEPEVTEPEVTEPEVTEPEATAPSIPTDDNNVPAGTVFAVYTADGNVTYYASASQLITVFKAMTEGTLKLYQDVALGNNKCLENYSGTITLDLNGCTVTNSYSGVGILYVDGAYITVTDTSAAGDGLMQNTHASGYGIQIWSGTCNLVAGNVEAISNGLRVENTGILIMSGGQVTAQKYGINITSAGTPTAHISGGIINQTVTGTFNRVLQAASTATVSITGGYFNGGAVSGGSLAGKISGGYFTNSFGSSYLASGCELQDNDDAVYIYKVFDPNAVPEDPDPSEPEATEPAEGVDRWNLVLEDDLKVNFYINADASAQIAVTIDGVTTTYNAADLSVSDDGKYIITLNLAAAQMTDDITVQVVGSDSEAKTYTVRQYADVVLADSNYSAYHSLIKEMLNYGAAAQMLFDYNTNKLAIVGIEGTGTASVPESTTDYVVDGELSVVDYYGASLICLDKITIRFYFTGDVTGCTFTDANGNTCESGTKNGMTYVDICNIFPQDLDDQVRVTVTDCDGNTMTVTYGPMNYIVRMNANGNDNVKALVKALYNYYLAAEALRIPA